MRILFVTRLHPLKTLGPLEARLNDRLAELSELGHEVLVLTKWTGEPIDFQLPERIEIRSPFKSFRPWEWPRALPMVFAWRPDVLHVFDPGLSALERNLSVEMLAITMLDTLARASRGRSSYRGSLVSMVRDAADESNSRASWQRAGAKVTESRWLRPVGSEKTLKPWDRAIDRRLRIVLAGEIGADRPLDHVIDALHVMRDNADFELTVFLDRTALSHRDRKRLARAERMEASGTNGTVAVGSRLKVTDPNRKAAEEFDSAIVAGLETETARAWIERLATPVVLSERHTVIATELERSSMSAQVLGHPVTEIASIAQSLVHAVDRTQLKAAWLKLERGELAGGRDIAANSLSRIYSQIAVTNSNPYS